MDTSISRAWRLLAATVLAVPLAGSAVGAADGPPELRLPPDVTYQGNEASPGPVVFSHTTHVPLAGTQCVACHPGLFSILQPTRRITHDDMNAARQCGACHDGTKASGVQDACDHCHRMGGGS